MSLEDWMEPDRRRERASSFGSAAALYDRIRPTYPPPAVTWALAPLGAGPWRVVDLGAGTGIMTRVISGLGQHTVAVEPDDLMRQRLTETTPGIEALPGTAESLPLPDGSVDAVIAAQAYHWFNRERAHREIGRVLRRGGVFAAIWNERDEATPWVAEYSRIVEGDRGPNGAGADSGRVGPASYGDLFGPVEPATFRHDVWHTPDSLVELLRSRSYYITAADDRKAALEAGVRQLAATHPDLAGRTEFGLPYETLVYRATRL